MPTNRRKRRHPTPRPELPCKCGRALRRFWHFCPWCGRTLTWGDDPPITEAECYRCGWVVSDLHTYCPWCGTDIYEEGVSSDEPLKAPKGFRFDGRCDAGCGGGVQYPMPYCPWCGEEQDWTQDDDVYDGPCPHCDRGVDDWMDVCPWCGSDPTGRDLVPKALTRVRQLLTACGIRDWGYRVILRPGVSGVDPHHPKVVEIDRSHVIGPRRERIAWGAIVGLICHELGHSFLYHHWTPLARSTSFKRIYGAVDKTYRVSDDTWVDLARKRPSGVRSKFVSAYAATHPLEDFAEVFRFYLRRRARMRDLLADLGRTRKDIIVYEKFLLLHRYVRSLRGWR